MTCACTAVTRTILLAAAALLPLACNGDDVSDTDGATTGSTTVATSSTTSSTSGSATTDDSSSSGSESAGESTTTGSDTATTTMGTTTMEEETTTTTTTTTTTGGLDPIDQAIIEGFDRPESAVYSSEDQHWYVSNIVGSGDQKDGNGFISRLNHDGSIETLQWVTGLNGPKGLGIANGRLFSADIDTVRIIDLDSGDLAMSVPINGAVFLNDVAVDGEGTVYVSDSGTNTIHMLKPGQAPEVFTQSNSFNRINGITFAGERMFAVSVGTQNDGTVFEVVNGAPVPHSSLLGRLDGVVARANDLLITDLNGMMYSVPLEGGDPTLVTNFVEEHGFMGSADLGIAPELKAIAVPDLQSSKVGFFPIE